MAKKKKLLDNEMIESITAQIELDRTAECFRAAHQEREDLIDQWEQTINQMRKRDEDMEKCTNVSWRTGNSLRPSFSVVPAIYSGGVHLFLPILICILKHVQVLGCTSPHR